MPEPYKIILTPETHDRLVDISGDKNRIHKEKNIMMGAHSIALLETHPEIKEHYILGHKISLPSLVTIDNPKEIIYHIEMIGKPDCPFFKYDVSLKEENNLFLKGEIITTDNYNVFKDVIETKIAKITDDALIRPKITDLTIDNKIIDSYYESIDSGNIKFYKEKYKGKPSSMFVNFLIPGKLFNTGITNLNPNKTYTYAGEEIDFLYLTNIDDAVMEIIGEKSKPKIFRNIEFNYLNFLIKSYNKVFAKGIIKIASIPAIR